MEGSRSSVSTLHPREHSDVLTNSTAPRADNYFCARADLAFASSFTASFPLSLSLFPLLSPSRRISARTNFSWTESTRTPPPVCRFAPFLHGPGAVVVKGTRGRGGRSSVLNHLNALHANHLHSKGAFPFRATLLWRRCTPRGVGPPPRTGNVLEGSNRGN